MIALVLSGRLQARKTRVYELQEPGSNSAWFEFAGAHFSDACTAMVREKISTRWPTGTRYACMKSKKGRACVAHRELISSRCATHRKGVIKPQASILMG